MPVWGDDVGQRSDVMSRICPRWRGAGVALLAVGCVSGTGPAPAEPEPGGLDLRRAEVIDLSHPYDDDSLFWPTSPTTFELTSLAYGPSDGGYFYAANTFCTPEHGGRTSTYRSTSPSRGGRSERCRLNGSLLPVS